MNWDDIRYFLAVADGKSLNAAARQLGVNHSTVFRRVGGFESAVGARLFERLPEGYQLTQAGEELAVHARRASEEFDAMQLKLLGKDFRPSGNVRMTAPDSIAYEFLPGYLADFRERYPDIRIELVVGAENLDLSRREADVALRATAEPPPHLVGRKLLSLRWAFFASPNYVARNANPGKLEALANHALIGASGPLRRLPAFRQFEKALRHEPQMRCSTLDAMSAMAVAGLGIALLPDDQQKPGLERLFELRPAVSTTLWLLTHPELRRTERIRLLMQHLYDAFRADDRLRPH